jgi:hypothetical protein
LSLAVPRLEYAAVHDAAEWRQLSEHRVGVRLLGVVEHPGEELDALGRLPLRTLGHQPAVPFGVVEVVGSRGRSG